ncbi:MAG: hypothetical protein AABY87_10800 [bacterium]
MPVETVLETWRARRDFAKRFTAERVFPYREGEYAPFPSWVPERLVRVLDQGGISSLYSHQRKAVDRIHEGKRGDRDPRGLGQDPLY